MVGERFGLVGRRLGALALVGAVLLAPAEARSQTGSGGAAAKAAAASKPATTTAKPPAPATAAKPPSTTTAPKQTGTGGGPAAGGPAGKGPAGKGTAVPAPTDPPSTAAAPTPPPTSVSELLPPPPPPPPKVEEPPPPPPPPPAAAPTDPAFEPLEKPVPISFDRKALYEIRVTSKKHPAEVRARNAEKALHTALEAGEETVRAEDRGDLAVVYAGKVPLLQVFPEDATAHGHSSLTFHADDVAVRFERLLEAEAQRKAIAHQVFSISLTVLMSLIALLLLRRTGEFGDRMHDWLEKNRDKVPSLHVQSLELVGPAAVQSGALLGVEVGKWLLRLLVIYFWALVSLSQFESTRSFVGEMTATFVRPLPDILRRTAASLPLFGVMLLGTAAVIVLVRFVQLFFAGVARRETELPWLRAELAEPVSFLLRLGIVLSALLFAAPVVTGSTEGVLPRAGLIALLTLGLAATPAVASLMVGVGTVFGQKLEPSDLVMFGGRRGRILHVGLFYVVLEDSSGAQIRVPQLMSLFHPTEFLAQRSRVRIEIPLKKLSREALDALRRAAESVGTDVDVAVISADSDGALIAVACTGSDDDASTRLFLHATGELEAAGLELGRTPRSRRFK